MSALRPLTTIRLNIESWGHVAGAAAAHLVAGRRIAVTGRWAKRKYHDRDHKRQCDYVIADRLTYLDAPPPEPGNSRQCTIALGPAATP